MPYTVALKNESVADGIACRLEITFDMPLYTTKGETGALLNLGEDGLPEQNGSFPYAAALIVPEAAQDEPARCLRWACDLHQRRPAGGSCDWWSHATHLATDSHA